MYNFSLLESFGFTSERVHLPLSIDMIEKLAVTHIPREIPINSFLRLFKELYIYDAPTAFHSIEVACISYWLGKKVLSEEKCIEIFIGGLLHDIGKLRFPQRVLKGAKDLTPKEKEFIRDHTIFGYEYIRGLTDSHIITDMVLYHHENVDGTGYPFKLKNSDISIYSKICRIADMLSALTSYREYREENNLGISKVLEVMEGQKEEFDKNLISNVLTHLKNSNSNSILDMLDSGFTRKL